MSHEDFDWPVRVILKKEDRIAYILNGICDYYGITLTQLQGMVRRPERANRRKIAIKMLRDIADVRLIDVMFALGAKSESAIWQSYDSITEDLQVNKSLQAEYDNIKQYLRL